MIIYGIITLNTSKYGFLNLAQTVKILTPNGGITVPSVACIVIKIPIATGSIPVATAIGRNIGVKIAMATNESTNILEIKKNKDIMKRISILDGSELNTASVNCCGILEYEIIQENAPPAANRINTILVTSPVEAAILYI